MMMRKPSNQEEADLVVEFLRESNAIEDVRDQESLDQALIAWEYLVDQPRITPHVILKTHKILMLHQRGLRPDQISYFRDMSQTDVRVGSYIAPRWQMVPDMIAMWCDLDESIGWHVRHVKFEEIHPFVDGNGRVGRMLLNWHRLVEGLPVLVIRELDKIDYYRWFR